MSNISTFREQFLADLDEIRQRRKRLRIATALIIPGCLVALVLSIYLHPFFLALVLVPIVFARVAQVQSYSVRCPRCGDFFFWRRPGSSLQFPNPLTSNTIFRKDSECVHCGFVV
jgi:hypothetical protein